MEIHTQEQIKRKCRKSSYSPLDGDDKSECLFLSVQYEDTDYAESHTLHCYREEHRTGLNRATQVDRRDVVTSESFFMEQCLEYISDAYAVGVAISTPIPTPLTILPARRRPRVVEWY